jgi:hypothetical protein
MTGTVITEVIHGAVFVRLLQAKSWRIALQEKPRISGALVHDLVDRYSVLRP